MDHHHRRALGALLFLLLAPLIAQAQDTGTSGGFRGFLQRAGNTVSSALHPQAQETGPFAAPSTTGATIRPMQPATGGEFVGLFHGFTLGQAWPRVALYFTDWGSRQPCWTVQATIWHSATDHHVETFQACNAPVIAKDDFGGTQPVVINDAMYVSALNNALAPANVTHSSDRTTGPNPPQYLFQLTWGNEQNVQNMYYQIMFRLMIASGFTSPNDKGIVFNQGKAMWVVGFDPTGKHG